MNAEYYRDAQANGPTCTPGLGKITANCDRTYQAMADKFHLGCDMRSTNKNADDRQACSDRMMDAYFASQDKHPVVTTPAPTYNRNTGIYNEPITRRTSAPSHTPSYTPSYTPSFVPMSTDSDLFSVPSIVYNRWFRVSVASAVIIYVVYYLSQVVKQ